LRGVSSYFYLSSILLLVVSGFFNTSFILSFVLSLACRMTLGRIKSKFQTPEHINDSEATAPSKRIKKVLPEYSKTLNGIPVAKRIGIDKISGECRHFKEWVESIKALAKDGVNDGCT